MLLLYFLKKVFSFAGYAIRNTVATYLAFVRKKVNNWWDIVFYILLGIWERDQICRLISKAFGHWNMA